jgi:hypothetical protein
VPAPAADDDGAQAAALFERIERRQQRLDQIAVIGIVALRPIEHDARHAAIVDVEQDRRCPIRFGHDNLQRNRGPDCIGANLIRHTRA